MNGQQDNSSALSPGADAAADQPPLVSLLTPPGRGSLATVLVSGRQADRCVCARFQPASGLPFSQRPFGHIAFGRWAAGPSPGEELVACRLDSDRVEIHCHGGSQAARTIIADLVSAGCREVPWQQAVARLAGGGLEAEARVALAQAVTVRTAAILLDQARGALRAAWEEIVDQLSGPAPSLAASQLANARAAIDELLDRTALGRHLTAPWKVVLAGPPNAGKSSLLNALLGYQRAIVFPQPGTTRDILTGRTALDGWPIELADTAGLRSSLDPIEAAGVAQARERLAEADLAVLVFDASQPWTASEETLWRSWPASLLVHQKCDLVPLRPADRQPGIWTSALRGEGIDDLIRSIVLRLVPRPPPPGAPVPFTPRQIAALETAAAALAVEDPTWARQVLLSCLAPVPSANARPG